MGRGLATADYDNDGDLEIMVSNMNSSPELLRHVHKNPNHSILVKTVGTKSNRDGIGAEVKVIAGNLTQYRHRAQWRELSFFERPAPALRPGIPDRHRSRRGALAQWPNRYSGDSSH